MPWVWLVLAGVCEVMWAVGLKKYGFEWVMERRWSWGGAATVGLMLLSFYLLSLAMRHIPLGTAYGVWTGIGAVGAAAYGIARLGEPRDVPRLLCIGLILAGIVGLKFLSPKAG
jgi:quaternary ammonium compound-resistance protein SugE